jgi:hypothetical protein
MDDENRLPNYVTTRAYAESSTVKAFQLYANGAEAKAFLAFAEGSAAKALRTFANGAEAKALLAFAEGPAAKALRTFANGPEAKALLAFAEGPAAKALRTFANSPEAKAILAFAEAPSTKALRTLAHGSFSFQADREIELAKRAAALGPSWEIGRNTNSAVGFAKLAQLSDAANYSSPYSRPVSELFEAELGRVLI